MKLLFQRFDQMKVGRQAVVMLLVSLCIGLIVAIAILSISPSDYTRDHSAEDARLYCADHGGVERFEYDAESHGSAQVICKDGALQVFP